MENATASIQSYGAGGFVVQGQRYDAAIQLHDGCVKPWDGALEETALCALAEQCQGAEILILGTGKMQQFISPAIRHAVKEACGIVLEPMDTGAACRTYNVLLAEDRKVALAAVAV